MYVSETVTYKLVELERKSSDKLCTFMGFKGFQVE